MQEDVKAIEQCAERSDSFLADLMLLPLLEQPGESDEKKQALCKMLTWNAQSLENVLAVPRFQGLEEECRPLPRKSLDKWEAFLPELFSKKDILVEEHRTKVKSHAAFSNAEKIFAAFADIETPVCPSTSCKSLLKSLFKGTKDQQKAIGNIPWASLLSWSQEADKAIEVCCIEESDAETKKVLLLPSFILARLCVSEIYRMSVR